jgi:hypothetical protein
MHSVKHLTIRNVHKRLADALERERRRRGLSLNQTVLDVLASGLGVDGRGQRRNGLADLAGTWSPAEHRQFEEHVRELDRIDDELWR